MTVAANPARVGAADVNVAVISPYSGGLGELMTMVEPAIATAAQDVENSNFLPGFRMNLFLGDCKCSVPGATQATIEALATSPTKHALLADSCSAACEAMNDATQFFNVLQAANPSKPVSNHGCPALRAPACRLQSQICLNPKLSAMQC